jgi:hypothetical protein
MKFYLTIAIGIFAMIGFVTWQTALSEEVASSPISPTESQADVATSSVSEEEQRLVAAEELIRDRINIAPMFVQQEGSETDQVVDLQAMGMIIEVTLEEVEAALAAAAATEEPEDDIEAARLQQWGSYRYYLDPIPSAEADPSEPIN